LYHAYALLSYIGVNIVVLVDCCQSIYPPKTLYLLQY
jgi:hypothetical protein